MGREAKKKNKLIRNDVVLRGFDGVVIPTRERLASREPLFFVWYNWLYSTFLALSCRVVAYIRGHIRSWLFSPPPQYGSCLHVLWRQDLNPSLNPPLAADFVNTRRALSASGVLLLLEKKMYHHGRIRTQGLLVEAIEGKH